MPVGCGVDNGVGVVVTVSGEGVIVGAAVKSSEWIGYSSRSGLVVTGWSGCTSGWSDCNSG